MQRNTRQREAIAKCFSREDRPMTATEVHAITVVEFPSLGIATVYRTVKAYVDSGFLAPVVIAGTTRYEIAEKAHHHHFYCLECDRAFCLKGCPISHGSLAPEGYSVESHDLVISGACPSCSQGASAVM